MTDIRSQLEDLALFVGQSDHHGGDQVVLHRERLEATLWRAIEKIDTLRLKLNATYD